MYSWGSSPEFPKQLSCIPFRFSCGGLRKGLLTFGTRVKQPFAQSAARRPKIAQSHKSCNKAPKFQLFPGSLPRISNFYSSWDPTPEVPPLKFLLNFPKKHVQLGGATSPLPAPPSRNRTKRQNQAIRKNGTIPQPNFYSSWGLSPEFFMRSRSPS